MYGTFADKSIAIREEKPTNQDKDKANTNNLNDQTLDCDTSLDNSNVDNHQSVNGKQIKTIIN
jgi:hypothetical protein